VRTWTLLLIPAIFLGGLLLSAHALAQKIADGPQCSLGTCPLTLHPSDSGHTFSYSLKTAVAVILNAPGPIRCTPSGILREVSTTDKAAFFETQAPGTCTLTGTAFTAKIVVR